MSTRREGRELALQALYSSDVEPLNGEIALKLIVESFGAGAEPTVGVTNKALSFALDLLNGVCANRAEIDKLIEEKSKNWSISRMARVDLNVLRLAAYELIYCPEIPKNVTINEAIEVAKKYGADESSSFVNGILDEIASAFPDKE